MQLRKWIEKSWVQIMLVFLLASTVYTWNLGGQYFTLDEPGTVLQAEGIRNLGYPSGWDGRNLQSDNNGREYQLEKGSYFYTWQPPLQSYTAYFGSSLFGQSVFGYRFLFTLFGAGTVALFYFIARQLFAKRWIVYLVTTQLLFCLPFFLYVRQVRYYAPSAFFATVFLYLTIRAWRREWGRMETVLLFVGSTFLFLTNYFVWAACVMTLGLLFLWQRQRIGVITLMVTGIVPVIWYLTVHPFAGNPTGAYGKDTNSLVQYVRYFPYIHSYLLSFFFLPFFFLGKRVSVLVYVLTGFVLLKLAVYAVFLNTHGRYLIDIIPTLFLILGFMYQTLDTAKTRVVIPIIALATLLVANLGSLFPRAALETVRVISTPQVYGSELMGIYPSVLFPLGAYLTQQYQNGDLFWTNEYRNTLYITSGIPYLSPVCDDKSNTPLGPASVTNRENIRWFIFFQGDKRLHQDVMEVPCLGPTWQERLEREFVRREFQVPPGYFLVNDPDIVGRKFPPIEAKRGDIIIYEKRQFLAIKET